MIKTDIHENDSEYLVEAELPGIPKENIQVTYENGILTIAGQHQSDTTTEDKKGKLIRSERSFNKCSSPIFARKCQRRRHQSFLF